MFESESTESKSFQNFLKFLEGNSTLKYFSFLGNFELKIDFLDSGLSDDHVDEILTALKFNDSIIGLNLSSLVFFD